ncbi:hypothetical protein PVL29_017329 [Vitis rotundifolia]|uniref:Tubulin--tyrosine ligase-like protein 12 SET-like domain-containing protein n=1 Tax=Vitis rotundifolia TaxID=103349 RepID=A0AA39DII1_VITRO|nr:hypothetical protein PVL29_017329 [Vitis rotundifolia]
MDEDDAVDVDNSSPSSSPPSPVTPSSSLVAAPRKTKGRGSRDNTNANCNSRHAALDFDLLDFDSGDFFQVQPCENGRQRRLVLTSDSMEKDSHVFLIDHTWTFRLSDAPKQLQEVPGLAERMATLMCVDIDMDSNSEETDAVNRGPDEKDTKLDVMRRL